MKFEKEINILMISSNADLGRGLKQMFCLGEKLNKCFRVFYAVPKNNNYSIYLKAENYIEISERKITPKDIFNLIKFIRDNNVDIIHGYGKGAGVLSRIINLFLHKNSFILFMVFILSVIVI